MNCFAPSRALLTAAVACAVLSGCVSTATSLFGMNSVPSADERTDPITYYDQFSEAQAASSFFSKTKLSAVAKVNRPLEENFAREYTKIFEVVWDPYHRPNSDKLIKVKTADMGTMSVEPDMIARSAVDVLRHVCQRRNGYFRVDGWCAYNDNTKPMFYLNLEMLEQTRTNVFRDKIRVSVFAPESMDKLEDERWVSFAKFKDFLNPDEYQRHEKKVFAERTRLFQEAYEEVKRRSELERQRQEQERLERLRLEQLQRERYLRWLEVNRNNPQQYEQEDTSRSNEEQYQYMQFPDLGF